MISNPLGVAWKGNSMFSDQFEAISAAPIGRWERDLGDEEVYIIQAVCKEGMAALGYAQAEIVEGRSHWQRGWRRRSSG